jgi:hypothetical protein
MVGKKCPGITGGVGFNENFFQPLKKINAISFIPKNILTLNSAANDVMYGTGRIDASFSRHKKSNNRFVMKKKLIISYLSPLFIFIYWH